jgi:hypothetical protein
VALPGTFQGLKMAQNGSKWLKMIQKNEEHSRN